MIQQKNHRLNVLRAVFSKQFVFWFLGITLAYLVVTVLVHEFDSTLKYAFLFSANANWPYLLVSMFLTVVIAVLVGINSVSGFVLRRQYLAQSREYSGGKPTVACAIGGFFTGVCPGCSSLLPSILGWFGIGFSWVVLPFKGLEVQVLIVILLISVFVIQTGGSA